MGTLESKPPELFHRYENQGDELIKRVFKLVRETRAGYWIIDKEQYCIYGEKWIPKASRKRFAYPTEQEALTSFIARKTKQIKILSIQLGNSKITLRRAQQQKEK